jgi:hypothetical protein
MNTAQVWMEEVVKAAIAKAMEHEPEGPDRDYWTTDSTLKDIKAKYGLKRFKPKPVTVTLVRECCGAKFVHVLMARESALCLKDPECADPVCRRQLATMPFGKFKGQTLAWVYEQEPSYLAWFHETVDGCKEVKEAIRGLPGIEAHLAAFRERHSLRKPLTSTQQEVEWLMGKFTAETVDRVCEELFGGDETS